MCHTLMLQTTQFCPEGNNYMKSQLYQVLQSERHIEQSTTIHTQPKTKEQSEILQGTLSTISSSGEYNVQMWDSLSQA